MRFVFLHDILEQTKFLLCLVTLLFLHVRNITWLFVLCYLSSSSSCDFYVSLPTRWICCCLPFGASADFGKTRINSCGNFLRKFTAFMQTTNLCKSRRIYFFLIKIFSQLNSSTSLIKTFFKSNETIFS